jgi:ATP-dependent Clp protease adapter protein ClpS
MYVNRPERGRGTGSALLDSAISVAISRGYKRMRLDTLGTMHDARRLYIRAGFREIPAYYNNPVPGAKYYELTWTAFAAQCVADARELAGQGPFLLVLYNDDETTMEFVFTVLQELAGMPQKLAWAIMHLVHETGQQGARRYSTLAEASRVCDAITMAAREEGFPLKVTVERTPD